MRKDNECKDDEIGKNRHKKKTDEEKKQEQLKFGEKSEKTGRRKNHSP